MITTDSKVTFAKNLRRFLESRGMQDKDLCEITGASQTSVSEWLSAKKFPRIDKIEKMANHFGVPKSALIDDGTETERKELEQQAQSIIHSLPDDYKKAAIDYLKYLAEKTKSGDTSSNLPR